MNRHNTQRLKNEIEETFGFVVEKIKHLGDGVDSNAYLVNDHYVFKFGISENSKRDYEVQKIFSDFYRENSINDIETPNIEFYCNNDKLKIVGYKVIDGTFVSRSLYNSMNEAEQNSFCKDVASFLRTLHNLSANEIGLDSIDMKEKMLNEVRLIKETLYDSLDQNEKRYIDQFKTRIINSDVFSGKRCICHVDFNPDLIIIDQNHKFKGVIDWGEAAITCEYAEFPYLLSDGEDELGREVGLKILEYFGDIDINKAIEYSNIHRMEYPITELIYGIKNEKPEKIIFGRKIIRKKCESDKDILNEMK